MYILKNEKENIEPHKRQHTYCQ